VIGGQWFLYLSDGANYFLTDEGQKLPMTKGEVGYQFALTALSKYLEILKLNNKKVFLILNNPIGEKLDPKYMAKRSMKNFPRIFQMRDGGINLSTLEEKHGFINDDLSAIAHANKVLLINPIKYLCNNNICPSVDQDNEPIYKDGVHLRPYFVRNKAGFVDVTVSN
jgi:hypothetical protein